MGECIKNGTAAGPKWTPWVLDEMTKVQGTTAAKDQQETTGGGRWGIIDGLPKEITDQGPVAIKNGWTMIYADGMWHVNCLAVTDDWVLAVLLRYPAEAGARLRRQRLRERGHPTGHPTDRCRAQGARTGRQQTG